MLIDERVGPPSPRSVAVGGRAGTSMPGLDLAAEAPALYADPRAAPFMRGLLDRSGSLLHGTAGSISLVELSGQRYHKVAEQGALCQLGRSFSLDEGVTGRVVARRAPVVLSRYGDVAGAHLPAGHPARGGAVLAVPIWWRGDVIGANVSFAGMPRDFTAAEVDDLETLTQLAAAGIWRSGLSEPTPRPTRPETVAAPPAEEASPLSDRERQVASLLSQGLRDRDIAQALVISPRTVEKHVAAVLRKTGATHRITAVLRCVAEGWVPAP